MNNRVCLLYLVPAGERGKGRAVLSDSEPDASIELYRDDDARSFRICIDSAMRNVELTLDELTELRETLNRAIEQHDGWH